MTKRKPKSKARQTKAKTPAKKPTAQNPSSGKNKPSSAKKPAVTKKTAKKPTKKTAKKPPAKKKHAGGRPSAYNEKFVKVAFSMAELGATDQELATACGVSVQTLNSWKKTYPEFLESLKGGKEIADEHIEKALFSRARGYSHPSVKITNYRGKIIKTPIIKHYAPDTTACIFWLKNRKPESWRDVQQNEHKLVGWDELVMEIEREEGQSGS